MLTNKQKSILENRIYNALKKGLKEHARTHRLNEAQEREFKFLMEASSETDTSKTKRGRVTKWLKRDSTNTAAAAYKLFNPRDEETDKANARGLFMKKLYKRPMDSGGVYDFTPDEINILFSYMTGQND